MAFCHEQRQHYSSSQALDQLLKLSAKASKNEKPANTRTQTLRIMRNYLERLSIDPSSLSVVHVAGTKGKGSTCAFAESIFRAKGLRTGLFTSPHLINVCERFRINGSPVPEHLFLEHFWAVWDGLHETVDRAGEFPPIAGFFRFLTLVALRMFLKERVDVAILEVGLGGRLDATNVIDHPVVCGITTLDLDHTNVLGSTLDLIAREKAGIFKEGVPAFTIVQETSAAAALKECAEISKTPLMILPNLKEYVQGKSHCDPIALGLKGSYQETNAALAIALCNTWFQRRSNKHTSIADCMRHFSDIDDGILKGLATCQWPGRSQTLRNESCPATFYVDGAHTPLSMECCVKWFNTASTSQSISTGNGSDLRILVFHCFHERAILPVLRPLLGEPFDYAIFCPVDHSRPSVVTPPSAAQILSQSGIDYDRIDEVKVDQEVNPHLQWQHSLKAVWDKVHAHTKPCKSLVMPSIAEAIQLICNLTSQQSGDHAVLVTGSLYLVGGVLDALGWKCS